MNPKQQSSFWRSRLTELAERLRRTARKAMDQALAGGNLDGVARQVGQGAGDATFGLDQATEAVLDLWLGEVSSQAPLSLFSEDRGWRHRGPGGECAGFDHGGPRIVIDPVDGTRNLMLDLRSAWTVIALAPPGPEVPRQSEVELGIVAEIPDSRGARWRTLSAERGGGCRLTLAGEERELCVDADARCDNGYFPFFAFHPRIRPAVAKLGARFFEQLEQEGIDTSTCFDDQYISSGGQLALIALGTYRMVVEPRAWLAARGEPTQTCKPYDIAGAVLCAEEAGALVTDLTGKALDHPLDARTPVSFCAFHNAATRDRLWPYLERALFSSPSG